jgi:hypothetical protein
MYNVPLATLFLSCLCLSSATHDELVTLGKYLSDLVQQYEYGFECQPVSLQTTIRECNVTVIIYGT